jgi:hypothetical protein
MLVHLLKSLAPVKNLEAEHLGNHIKVTWSYPVGANNLTVDYFVLYRRGARDFNRWTSISKESAITGWELIEKAIPRNNTGNYEYVDKKRVGKGKYVYGIYAIKSVKKKPVKSEFKTAYSDIPQAPRVLKVTPNSMINTIMDDRITEDPAHHDLEELQRFILRSDSSAIPISQLENAGGFKRKFVMDRVISIVGKNFKGVDHVKLADRNNTRLPIIVDDPAAADPNNFDDHSMKVFVPLNIVPGKYSIIMTNSAQGFSNNNSKKLKIISPKETAPSEVMQPHWLKAESNYDRIVLRWKKPLKGGHPNFYEIKREYVGPIKGHWFKRTFANPNKITTTRNIVSFGLIPAIIQAQRSAKTKVMRIDDRVTEFEDDPTSPNYPWIRYVDDDDLKEDSIYKYWFS